MSTSSARSAAAGARLGASGMSARKPATERGTFFNHAAGSVPARGCGFAREELARQREVGLGAARLDVVEDGGQAVARRFAEADVARDDGRVDAVLEERANVARHLLPEIRALVVHRHQHAGDVERRVERAAHAAQRGDEIGEPLEREVFAVERNQHGVGGDERVEREQPERRRRVDEDEVEAVAERVEHEAQPRLAVRQRDELDFGAGEVAIGRDERAARPSASGGRTRRDRRSSPVSAS